MGPSSVVTKIWFYLWHCQIQPNRFMNFVNKFNKFDSGTSDRQIKREGEPIQKFKFWSNSSFFLFSIDRIEYMVPHKSSSRKHVRKNSKTDNILHHECIRRSTQCFLAQRFNIAPLLRHYASQPNKFARRWARKGIKLFVNTSKHGKEEVKPT